MTPNPWEWDEFGLNATHLQHHLLKGASIVIADISGFTKLNEKFSAQENGAEQVSQHISSYFTLLLSIIERHGGDVVKFAGDALIVLFSDGYQGYLNDQIEAERAELDDNWRMRVTAFSDRLDGYLTISVNSVAESGFYLRYCVVQNCTFTVYMTREDEVAFAQSQLQSSSSGTGGGGGGGGGNLVAGASNSDQLRNSFNLRKKPGGAGGAALGSSRGSFLEKAGGGGGGTGDGSGGAGGAGGGASAPPGGGVPMVEIRLTRFTSLAVCAPECLRYLRVSWALRMRDSHSGLDVLLVCHDPARRTQWVHAMAVEVAAAGGCIANVPLAAFRGDDDLLASGALPPGFDLQQGESFFRNEDEEEESKLRTTGAIKAAVAAAAAGGGASTGVPGAQANGASGGGGADEDEEDSYESDSDEDEDEADANAIDPRLRSASEGRPLSDAERAQAREADKARRKQEREHRRLQRRLQRLRERHSTQARLSRALDDAPPPVLPIFDPSAVLRQGTLLKKGRSYSSRYSPRYCVLFPDRLLYFLAKPKNLFDKAVGRVMLQRNSVVAQDADKERNLSLREHPIAREFWFKAPSRAERDAWVEALVRAVGTKLPPRQRARNPAAAIAFSFKDFRKTSSQVRMYACVCV